MLNKSNELKQREKALAREEAKAALWPSEGWMSYPNELPLLFTIEEASIMILLVVLMNMDRKWRNLENRDGEWFHFSTKQVKKELGYADRSQELLFRKLKDKGMITTKAVGIPPKRYIYIEYEYISELLKEARRNKMALE